MGFTALVGHATAAGPREHNEDFVGMILPHEPELSAKGMIAAIADGVPGNGHGGEAAEHAVRNLLDDYYATPDTWHVRQTLERIVNALHGWMRHHSLANTGNEGMATTLTALVLTGHPPYGEIEAFQRPRFGQPAAPHRYRPDLPDWLDQVLLKAVARDPADRFETAEGILLALEAGASQPMPVSSAAPVSRRDPSALWRLVSVAAIALNLLLLYLLVVR